MKYLILGLSIILSLSFCACANPKASKGQYGQHYGYRNTKPRYTQEEHPRAYVPDYVRRMEAFRWYVIRDTVYGDYKCGDRWVSDKSKADRYEYHSASRWLRDFRKNERGEYANTGAEGYPVQIEPAGD